MFLAFVGYSMHYGHVGLARGIGLCLYWEFSWISDIFTKSDFAFIVVPTLHVGNILHLSAYFQRKRMVSVISSC